jgi:hypothetical protein
MDWIWRTDKSFYQTLSPMLLALPLLAPLALLAMAAKQ